ncbi:MAG: DoxX family protein [Gemmatimonadaceae bacterium]
MSFFRNPTQHQIDFGLAVLRIVVGVIFIGHGSQKLFAMGFTGVAGAFGHMGVPLPGFTGPFIAVLEFCGGIGLILGLLTRLFAFGFFFDMLGAITIVKWSGGVFGQHGYEFELTLCAAGFALMLMGAGRFSIDGLIARRKAAVTTSA